MLDGVLCAGGVLTSSGGHGARLAIVLGAPPEVAERADDDDESAPVARRGRRHRPPGRTPLSEHPGRRPGARRRPR